MEKIKVFISDHQVLFREGIHFTLSGEDDFEVIGESTSNEEAFTAIEANPPNIAVLSMRSNRADGPSITGRIKRQHPTVSVILVMDSDENEPRFQALKSGASACITKDTDPNYLLDMLRVIAQGSQPIIELLLTPEMAARTLTEFEELAALGEQLDDMLAKLSAKESETLSLLAGGSTLEQVITKLNTNESTVRRNLRTIAGKMMNNEQTKSLLMAAQRGMPGIIPGRLFGNGHSEEYVTRAEFLEFKENLTHRLKSFIGELA